MWDTMAVEMGYKWNFMHFKKAWRCSTKCVYPVTTTQNHTLMGPWWRQAIIPHSHMWRPRVYRKQIRTSRGIVKCWPHASHRN